MNFSKHYRVVFILALLLAGCLILPIPNKPPFPEELLTKLASPSADKNLVSSLFGAPSAVKKAGEYWFYGNAREVAVLMGGSDAGIFWDFEWLAVQFDQHKNVTFYEFNDNVHGCLSNGICNLGNLNSTNEGRAAVLTAPDSDDVYAQNHEVSDNECAIYFYQEPVFHLRLANGPVSLIVDNVVVGIINYETYLFVTHTPGVVALKSYQFTIKAQCNAGERLYLRAEEAGWSVKEGKGFARVSSTVGEQEIKKRRLALPD